MTDLELAQAEIERQQLIVTRQKVVIKELHSRHNRLHKAYSDLIEAKVAPEVEGAYTEIDKQQDEIKRLNAKMDYYARDAMRCFENEKVALGENQRLRAAIQKHHDDTLYLLDGLNIQGQWNAADHELWLALGIDEKGPVVL